MQNAAAFLQKNNAGGVRARAAVTVKRTQVLQANQERRTGEKEKR